MCQCLRSGRRTTPLGLGAECLGKQGHSMGKRPPPGRGCCQQARTSLIFADASKKRFCFLLVVSFDGMCGAEIDCAFNGASGTAVLYSRTTSRTTFTFISLGLIGMRGLGAWGGQPAAGGQFSVEIRGGAQCTGCAYSHIATKTKHNPRALNRLLA